MRRIGKLFINTGTIVLFLMLKPIKLVYVDRIIFAYISIYIVFNITESCKIKGLDNAERIK